MCIRDRVYVDKRVLLRHSGSYVFCMENQQHLMDTIGPMYLAELQKKQQEQQTASTTTVQTEAPAEVPAKAPAKRTVGRKK